MKSRIGKTAHHQGEEFITCQEVITFLLEYLAKDLAPEEEREFERHLALCPSCVAYLETYRQTVRLGRIALQRELEAAPPELNAELMQAILQARA